MKKVLPLSRNDCKKKYDDSRRHELITYDENDDRRFGPHFVNNSVKVTLEKWGPLIAIPPDKFLTRILSSRGYSTEVIQAVQSRYRRQPTVKELTDYDSDLIQCNCFYSSYFTYII